VGRCSALLPVEWPVEGLLERVDRRQIGANCPAVPI
jgi:hypothetical protein